MKQITFAPIAYTHKKVTTKQETFLNEMERVVPWSRLLKLIEPWLLGVSCGFQHGTCRAGDHGDECLGVAVAARPGPGGLEQAIEPFYARIGVGGCPTPDDTFCMGSQGL